MHTKTASAIAVGDSIRTGTADNFRRVSSVAAVGTMFLVVTYADGTNTRIRPNVTIDAR